MSASLRRDHGPVGLPHLDAGRYAAPYRTRLSGPALRTFMALSERWQLSEIDRIAVLGHPARSTFHGWLKAARADEKITLSVDTLTRLSALLGIHQALGVLHEREADAIAWLRRPNLATVFGGDTPLALMVEGGIDGLLTTRRFLDAARGGLSMEPNAADRDFRPYTDADLVVQ